MKSACGVDNIDAPDVLFVSDADAVLPCCSPPEPSGEALDRSLSATLLGATTTTSPSLGVVSLSLDKTTIDGNATYDTDADGINDSDFQTLHEHGFTDEDAWDIAGIAAFFGLSNRMANVTSMRANPEFYSLGR